MDLVANSWLFRAEAMRLDWGAALEQQIAFLRQSHSPLHRAGHAEGRRARGGQAP